MRDRKLTERRDRYSPSILPQQTTNRKVGLHSLCPERERGRRDGGGQVQTLDDLLPLLLVDDLNEAAAGGD